MYYVPQMRQKCRNGVEQMKKILALLGLGCLGTPTADESVVTRELLENVASIQQAQLDLLVLGEFTACDDETVALSQTSLEAREWTPSKCWSDIGWAPSAAVHGGYWVEVHGDDFIVTGIGPDLSGTPRLRVTATKTQAAKVTP